MTQHRVLLAIKYPLTKRIFILLALCAALPAAAAATDLKPETATAFQHYVDLTETRMAGERDDSQRFLYFDSLPENQRQVMLELLHNGQIIVQPLRTMENGQSIEIPGGMVHQWLAIGFMPGATLQQARALAQDYPRQEQIYASDVQKVRVLSHDCQQYIVDFRFYRQAILTVVYNTEFSVAHFEPATARAYTVARATRIAEVENPGKPDESEYPVGNDHGYTWRLNLYTRYEEKDGGVYMPGRAPRVKPPRPGTFCLARESLRPLNPPRLSDEFLRLHTQSLFAATGAGQINKSIPASKIRTPNLLVV